MFRINQLAKQRSLAIKVVSIFLIIVSVTRMLLPDLKFREHEYNITFHVTIFLISIVFFLLLYSKSIRVKKASLGFFLTLGNTVIIMTLVFAIFAVIKNIDPEVRYFDVSVHYLNSDNPNEKIINQSYTNWKTGEEKFTENYIHDFGPLRITKPLTPELLNTIAWVSP